MKIGAKAHFINTNGTIVGGLRFIEESGWYGNSAVFAAGSANPHISEYRVLDVKSAICWLHSNR